MNNTNDLNAKELYEAILHSLEDCSDNLERFDGDDALDYLAGIIDSISAFGLILRLRPSLKKEKTQEECCCQSLESKEGSTDNLYRNLGSNEFSVHFARRFKVLEKSSGVSDIKEDVKNS